jgi:hypothetical protein
VKGPYISNLNDIAEEINKNKEQLKFEIEVSKYNL